jgi:kynurenine formamidase
MMGSKLIDVSHTMAHRLVTYKGLPDDNFRFFAVPVKVKAFGTFPVRAFGLV